LPTEKAAEGVGRSQESEYRSQEKLLAMLIGNINSMVAEPVVPEPAVLVAFVLLVMVFMALCFAVVVWIIVAFLRRKSGNELKQTITNQQTQIDDLKRKIEEMERKLER